MRNALVAALWLAMTTTAIVYAQKVNVDSDPAAPFATYKTYAWVKGTPAPNPLSEDRLHSAAPAHRLGGRQQSARGCRPPGRDPGGRYRSLTNRDELPLFSLN